MLITTLKYIQTQKSLFENVDQRVKGGYVSYNFDNVTVLLAEDIRMMQDLTCYSLGCLGIKNVLRADNGQRAYEIYRSQTPDIIICDWQMTPINGLELVKMIRQDKMSFMRTVPIIMLTGFASEAYVMEARDAGVNEFLVKPFAGEALAGRLASVIERPKSYVETSTYFGPDRRRKNTRAGYTGPMRRVNDHAVSDRWSIEF
jgi:two-component system chemotaxis response regulator CheY